MLSAKRKSDGETVYAYFEKKSNGPFICLDCHDEVILKSGRSTVDHFAHLNPLSCGGIGESDIHRRCKFEIFKALREQPNVEDVALERDLGPVRPDISARIDGIPVAIEVQISSLSLDSILERTIWYHRKGIYVLWLLQWTPKLDLDRYSPKLWEKWIHACYFGRVYYWLEGLNVVSYSFEPSLQSVPRKTWYGKDGKKITRGGYSKRSERYRRAVRGEMLNFANDFGPKERFWWEGGGLKCPDAKLWLESQQPDSV
jgi:competence protein CoiA